MRKKTRKRIEALEKDIKTPDRIKEIEEETKETRVAVRDIAKALGILDEFSLRRWAEMGGRSPAMEYGYFEIREIVKAIIELFDIGFRTTKEIPAKFEAFKKPKEKKEGGK